MRTVLDVVVLALLLLIALLSGCASMYGIPTMPSDQLAKSMANADASCITFPTPWGQGKAVTLGSDKGVIRNGALRADKDCNLEMINTAPPKNAP